MIPMLRNLDDVKQVVSRLPYTAPAERKSTALACKKTLQTLKGIGTVPVKDFMELTNDLRRFLD